MKDLNKLKIHELRDVAKEYAIVGRWHMKKKNLRDSIKEVMKKKEEGIFPCHKSLKDLQEEAKGLKIVGIGMLKKNGLRKVIKEKKDRRATDEEVSCIHEDDFFSCSICKENRF